MLNISEYDLKINPGFVCVCAVVRGSACANHRWISCTLD